MSIAVDWNVIRRRIHACTHQLQLLFILEEFHLELSCLLQNEHSMDFRVVSGDFNANLCCEEEIER